MRRSLFLLLTLLIIPLTAQASWWNDGWAYRKELTLDTTATGANIASDLQNVPVLIRLHTGNFGYFLDIQPKAEDIRFIAGDDQTPLKFNIERFDAINEMALIWVVLPELKAGSKATKIWMYYGSQNAVAAEDVSGSYGPHQTLVYHFADERIPPIDATAYDNRTSQFDAELNVPTLIGNGVRFNGQSNFVIADSPVLVTDPAQGWTWSAWLKIDAEQNNAFVFERVGDAGTLVLGVEASSLYARWTSADGKQVETPRNAQLTTGSWHHVALTIGASRMALFLDGNEVAYVDSVLPALQGDMTVGSSATGDNGFIGDLDELNIYNNSRSASWFQAAISSQGIASKLLIYGEDGAQESEGGGESHFSFVMKKLTFDAKIVIVFLLLMSVVSWVVMIMKWFHLRRVAADNKKFLEAYYALGTDDPAMLDRDDSEQDKELGDSPVAQAMFGEHDHFQSSPIYHMYHRGISEVKARVGSTVGAQAVVMKKQSTDAIRAMLDADTVRESQKINSNMVLLTIAISGGPFIGLLGTVIGVMITFAEMASTGDVSIASIAPGMSAALMATIVGLWVAIPALFGYNYLSSKIKNIAADMHVFNDEFVTRVAEYYGK